MGQDFSYQFYLRPEQTYAFFGLLTPHFGPLTPDFVLEWAGGQRISHRIPVGLGWAYPLPTPVTALNTILDARLKITLLLEEDAEVRAYLGLPRKSWKSSLQQRISQAPPVRHEVGMHGDLDLVLSRDPVSLQWETDEPEYVRVALETGKTPMRLLLMGETVEQFVKSLAMEISAPLLVRNYDDCYCAALVLDGIPLDLGIRSEFSSPRRVRELAMLEKLDGDETSSDPLERAAALWKSVSGLRTGDRLTMRQLALWSQDESELVRVLATLALGTSLDAEPEDYEWAFDDPSPRVRQMACEGLMYWPGEEVVPEFWKLVRDNDPGARVMASRGLMNAPEDDQERLEPLARRLRADPHPQVRLSGRRVLGETAV